MADIIFVEKGDVRPKVDQGDKTPPQSILSPKDALILNKRLSLKLVIRNVDQERSDARNKTN